ncbi:hypothetical protein [Propylenella binzhouense]|uniref:Uncharacterized protein n=1 Tax=Propylenella binzhouense TaxID=2555902 RepID=A0A964T962_9HYPH|nr:hypothetical protein [Propylenella binzhouense]MYZ49632.1 hypothetical protein [Propylenella binzhouense]
MKCAGVVALTLALLAAAEAEASQDLCKDVLVNGTMAVSSWTNDIFLSQVLQSRELTEAERGRATGIQTGMEVPIEGLPVSGHGNANDRRRYYESAQKFIDFRRLYKDQSSAMIASGDPTIVGAWRDCMRSSRGLFVHFEPVSAGTTRLHVEWHSYPVVKGVSSSTLITSALLSSDRESKLEDIEGCLQKGFEFRDQQRCTVTIAAPPEAWLTVTIHSEHEAASAELPPRLRMEAERQPFNPPDEAGVSAYDQGRSGPEVCVDAPEGWTIVEGSVFQQTRVRGKLPSSSCNWAENPKFLGDAKRVCWRAKAGPVRAKGENRCFVKVAGDLIRWKPVPSLP